MEKHYSKIKILVDKVRSTLIRLTVLEYHSKIELECSNVSPNNKLVNSYFYPKILKNLNSKLE